MSNKDLTVSIITVVYNNVKFIGDAIESVLTQDYPYIEYVVIDGGSDDGTLDIIEKYRDKISVFISEKDSGIYDALNKGIQNSSGDFITILHSDDLFSNPYVVSNMINKISDSNAEICFSDLVIINKDTSKILRYYKVYFFNIWLFKIGWMPPHPTFFIKKSLFCEFGLYSLNYKLASDFDFLVRIFYNREIKWFYLNQVNVKMRSGGASNLNLKNKLIICKEISQSLKSNNVKSSYILQLLRLIIRLLEFVRKPKYEQH